MLVLAALGPVALVSIAASSRASVTPPGATGTHAAPAVSSSSRCWAPRPEERGFHRKINSSRSNGGRSRLRLDPELSKSARVHTREMFERAVLHHTSTVTLGQRVTRWNMLGENVGVGHTVDSLHTAFMNSPAHRDNVMLRSFRYVGIGTRMMDGRLWVTVIFENQVDPGTRLRMPRCRRG